MFVIKAKQEFKDLKTKNNYSFDELAKLCNVHTNTIYEIIIRDAYVQPRTAEKISNALGKDMDDIFYLADIEIDRRQNASKDN